MKREELIPKIERIINVIENNRDLPLDIDEIRVFGSILYGKRSPNDADILMIYGRLSDKESLAFVDWMDGYTTSPFQKMNHRLKANAEKVHISYESSSSDLEWPLYPVSIKIWSKTDRDWKPRLQLSQEQVNKILLDENERLKALAEWYLDTIMLYDATIDFLIQEPSLKGASIEEAKQKAELQLRNPKARRGFRWSAPRPSRE